jgi:hypothetical protein
VKPEYHPDRNERRRLERLLSDERYGPALVRLNKTGQREIFDLVSAGDTKRVRARLLELDAQRREKVRNRSNRRRLEASGIPVRPGAVVTSDMVRAHRRMAAIMERNGWGRGVPRWRREAEQKAEPAELRRLVEMTTDDEIYDQGSEDAYAAQRGEIDYSPFWYHWN